jgi:two-component system nitrogen regulation response regulator NtrX
MSSVLIVDDEPNIRRMVGALLASEGYEVRDAADGQTGVARAAETSPDVVLLDLMMPGELDGLGTLERLRDAAPDVPVIMMSGKAGLSDAVKATKLGAFNFLEKPLSPEGVLLALASALELRRVRREARSLREDLGLAGEMIGESSAMARVRELIARVAPTDARVHVTGESGTGKELVASAIHLGSARRDRPFVRVNCAAIPRDLVESEMFGHEKGAFTGAATRRAGRFELAGTGTLFLDEIGDLDASLQTKLLRVLQDGRFERVGGGEVLANRGRLIAATNKAVRPGQQGAALRDDLYYRLAVIEIELPPLRARRSDVPLLVAHALAGTTARAVSEEAMARLLAYDWPGNVRELVHVVQRAAAMCGGEVIDAPDLPPSVLAAKGSVGRADAGSGSGADAYDAMPLREALAALEKRLIERALERAGGNRAEAARILGIARPQLYTKMEEHGITRSDARHE